MWEIDNIVWDIVNVLWYMDNFDWDINNVMWNMDFVRHS